MNWISVEDRLPELPGDSADRAFGMVVLVASEDGRVLAARWVDPPQFGRPPRPPRWEEYDGSRLFQPVVTHWMPLPAHPASPSDGAGGEEFVRPGWSGRW
jgi:hypothetical protein